MTSAYSSARVFFCLFLLVAFYACILTSLPSLVLVLYLWCVGACSVFVVWMSVSPFTIVVNASGLFDRCSTVVCFLCACCFFACDAVLLLILVTTAVFAVQVCSVCRFSCASVWWGLLVNLPLLCHSHHITFLCNLISVCFLL